ncbi:MAG: hypothetical protein PHX62_02500 [Bacilli bacterium]|nr:hypothetical protein [Bacilli bacterium]
MKKLLYNLIIINLLILPILVIKNTYAIWANTLSSNSNYTGLVKIGYWKEIIILTEGEEISDPQEGDEFFYNDEVYIVLDNSISTIPADPDWWGWNNPWSKVNVITSEWISNNYYDQTFLPVSKDGKYYLALGSGANNNVPGSGSNTWFEVSLQYISTNVYKKGFIVASGTSNGNPRYWIAIGQYINPGLVPANNAWAWEEVLPFNGSVASGKHVYTLGDNDEVHFWKALKNTTNIPSTLSASTGDYHEIKNGWISPVRDEIINHWVNHNLYQNGDTVTYGSDNALRYRYYRSIKTSLGEAPMLVVAGEEVLNQEYWEEI